MATASLPLLSHPPLHTDDNVSSTQCAAVDAEREGKLTETLAFKALPSVWFVSVPIKTRVPHCMDAHHAYFVGQCFLCPAGRWMVMSCSIQLAHMCQNVSNITEIVLSLDRLEWGQAKV